MIYFNYAASTPFSTSNLKTYLAVSEQYFSLPSMNIESSELEEQAKEIILETIDYQNHRLTFTSGGTEANNIAVIGFAKKFSTPKHFITSYYEHSSCFEAFKHIEKLGHKVTYLMPNDDGVITYEDIDKKICDNTVMVSLMQVNNEIGSVNDVNYIFGKVKARNFNIVTMSDVTQAVGKITLPNKTVTDIITFTAHKIFGPKACGAIVTSPNLSLRNILYGGYGLRPGTQNLAAQITFAKAVKDIYENMQQYNSKISELTRYLEDKIDEAENIYLNCRSRSTIYSIYVDTIMLGEVLINELYSRGFEVSTKSACSTKSKDLSRSLMSLDLDTNRINKSLRISISHLTTFEEIDLLFKNLKEISDENNFNKIW